MRAAENLLPTGHIRRPSTISHVASDITAAGARRVSLHLSEMRQGFGKCVGYLVPVLYRVGLISTDKHWLAPARAVPTG